MKVNLKLSKELNKQFNCEPQLCYTNSATIIEHLISLNHDKIKYIEGVGVDKFRLHHFDHGWIELDGTIIDATLREPENYYYHPIYQFSYDEMIEQVELHDAQFPLFQNGKNFDQYWFLTKQKIRYDYEKKYLDEKATEFMLEQIKKLEKSIPRFNIK
jgi:hypothetical protein